MLRANSYLLLLLWVGLFNGLAFSKALAGAAGNPTLVKVVGVQGTAMVLPSGAQPDQWVSISPSPTNPVSLGPGAQLKVGTNSRAVIFCKGFSSSLGPESHLILPNQEANRFKAFLKRGWFYFFHRDKPDDFDIETPTVAAAIRGTEFVMKVEENLTLTTVVDGQVELTNARGRLTLTNGDSAETPLGGEPVRTAIIQTINTIQWCLYYPAVLDVAELNLSDQETQVLAASLADYRKGDLLAALRDYPGRREPVSDAEKVYRASLLLAVGEIEEAQRLLENVPSAPPNTRLLADAVQKLMGAVRFNPNERSSRREEALIKSGVKEQSLLTLAATNHGVLASEWLAESYYRQSRTDQPKALDRALEAANISAALSPEFGFAWTRVAELEFSFGRTDRAMAALKKGLKLSPRNAQALALRGFLFEAGNRISVALNAFNEAIEVDPALANAWLGRGVCRIMKGDAEGGRQDLQVAATLEPQRAFLRSYLGKAFSLAGDNRRAAKELELAKGLDPRDPTAWLYSALLRQQQNQINQAVRDLEQSQELNENRRLYRSRFLLDQDRAVRSANLAEIYQDAGMADVAVREATRAVQADYANFSAHLFLANCYDQLRDPNQVELRYETAWLNEYLLANLLAPVGAGTLSPYISQQEYSRLFEQDRLGLASSTEYLSRGAWSQAAAQYGKLGAFAYSVEEFYRTDPGQRPNNDIELLTLDFKAKQQISAKDSLYFQVIRYDAESGDTARYYDTTNAHLGLRAKETQQPMVLAGYHRQWSPESHTLILGGVLNDKFHFSDPDQPEQVLLRNAAGQVLQTPSEPLPTAPLNYSSEFNAFTMEAQQIWQPEPQAFVVGGRYQRGTFDTRAAQANSTGTFFPDAPHTGLTNPPMAWHEASPMERMSVYGYWNWEITNPLLLTVGASYDYLRFPANFRLPPLTSGEESTDRVSPKMGVILTPFKGSTVRGAFTRSLGGVSFDQSVRLEPTQIGGFNQAYRSLMPESVVGSLSASRFETWGFGVDQKLGHRTYFGAQFEWLKSEAAQSVGTRDFIVTGPPSFEIESGVSTARQSIKYAEKNLLVTFNQLLGDQFALGARYKLSDAQLRSWFPGVPMLPDEDLEAILHQVQLYGLFYHPTGFFGQGEGIWNHQSNRGYTRPVPGDDFWQVNLHAGYRFPRRRAEVRLSLLNVANQDYRLNPLNLTPEWPRTRTLAASLRFYF